MLLTSARPLKFKCVGPASIGETSHVREESLLSSWLGFERLRVVKEANNVTISVTVYGERRFRGISKRRILNENSGDRGMRQHRLFAGNKLRGELFSSKRVDLKF